MKTFTRIATAGIGLLLAASAFQWIFVPDTAAAGLYLTIPEDTMARSTLIGDFSAFFVTGAAMCWVGALRQEATWLHASALLLGTAALFRLNAYLFHGAGLPYELIGIEVFCALFLLWAAPRVHLDRRHQSVTTHNYGSEV